VHEHVLLSDGILVMPWARQRRQTNCIEQIGTALAIRHPCDFTVRTGTAVTNSE